MSAASSEDKTTPTSSLRTRRRIRALFLSLGLVCLGFGFLGSTSFFGLYYLTLARYAPPQSDQIEKLLRRSLAHDPTGGRANIELARLLDQPGSYGAALDHLRRGMLTNRPVSSYIQLGRLLHRIGGRSEEARQTLEAAVRMNPGNVRAMEQLALIALAEANSVEVERWTDAIRNRDFSNLNSLYLRARDAERVGNRVGARTMYQTISSMIQSEKPLPQGTLFTRDEIRRRLELPDTKATSDLRR
jgi:Tfp pilus assembly protein PilF